MTTTRQGDQSDYDIRPTRRGFVTGAAKKAAYVAPAVLALAAVRRVTSDFTGCTGTGSPCTQHTECCSVAAMARRQPGGMACMGDPDCTCDPNL